MRTLVLCALLAPTLVVGQSTLPRSAPIADVKYDVTIDSAAAGRHVIDVTTTFSVTGPGPVVVALPGWTPGHYLMIWFSKWVSQFSAAGDGHALDWQEVDYETWRIDPHGAKNITVRFEYRGDTLDNSHVWHRPDFASFNGTNLFLYPVGQSLAFPATVTINTEPSWRITTGMTPGAAPRTYTATNYHDLVDMPFFVGRFDLDSVRVADKWVRLAVYPAGLVTGARRAAALTALSKVIPPEIAVFHDAPWSSYTVLEIADSTGGGNGLEHQNSHFDIVGTSFLDASWIPGLYAHEIFHSWNVKRLRPADLVPYRYAGEQPTEWLWVSEGITDYYADLAQVRGGVTSDSEFFAATANKIAQVNGAPPVALTDASLSTWVRPTDGTALLYYPKGSLAGFMLDIIIRDASDNARSLDNVMRELYEATYKKGRGFTGADWWGAVSRAAGGRSFDAFTRHYVDGRDPFPWDSILPLAGLRLVTDTVREPRFGIAAGPATAAGMPVIEVVAGGAAAAAGVHVGDTLTTIDGVPVAGANFALAFRARYSNPTVSNVSIVVRRAGQTVTLTMPLRLVARPRVRVMPDPSASPKAVRVRDGIVHGG